MVESNSTNTQNNSTGTAGMSANSTDPTEFKFAMRSLWVDHIVWTRQYIVDVSADLPSANDTANRLLRNQEDIGNAIKPYYGDAAGNQLTELLKQHILIAVDLVAAAKEGNATALSAANATWYQNADDIVTFLSTANPNFDKDEMKAMYDEHLRLTTNEAVARLSGDHLGDIAAFDQINKQAMSMADDLSWGIIAQFPEQFEDTGKAQHDSATASTTGGASQLGY